MAGRAGLALLVLAVAIAGASAQGVPPVSITDFLLPSARSPSPAPTAPAPTPADPSLATPALGPAPAVPAPLPAPAFAPIVDQNLLVKPEELDQAIEFLSSLLNSSDAAAAACPVDKVASQYYALSSINCDRAQQVVSVGTSLTACPDACKTGVDTVGANCTTALNVAYLIDLAAKDPTATLASFDPVGALAACGVPLSDAKKSAAFDTGRLKALLAELPGTLLACNTTVLENGAFAKAKAQCATASAAGSCQFGCSTAINAAGEACLKELAVAALAAVPDMYNAELKQFEVCGVSGVVAAPTPAPVPAPEPAVPDVVASPPPVVQPPPPRSGAVKAVAVTATAVAAATAVLL